MSSTFVSLNVCYSARGAGPDRQTQPEPLRPTRRQSAPHFPQHGVQHLLLIASSMFTLGNHQFKAETEQNVHKCVCVAKFWPLSYHRYSVVGFIDKNKDTLFQDFKRLLYNR